MRPGSAVATACLAVLSVWRFAEGEPGWAAVFAGLALAQLGFALRGPSTREPAVRPADPTRRNWVRIAVANLVLAVAAVFWFPPLALVLAGLGVYSAYRARSSQVAMDRR
jgi:ferric-dicitrate binding protein FerR (iron transport regulator)